MYHDVAGIIVHHRIRSQDFLIHFAEDDAIVRLEPGQGFSFIRCIGQPINRPDIEIYVGLLAQRLNDRFGEELTHNERALNWSLSFAGYDWTRSNQHCTSACEHDAGKGAIGCSVI